MNAKLRQAAVALLVGALSLGAFAGFAALNDLGVQPLRVYGKDWFDRTPPKEGLLFLALFAFAAPAALFLGRAADALAGDRLLAAARRAAARPRLVVGILAGVALAATLLAGHFVTQYAPFTDDEQTYRFQASLLADGRLSAPVPPVVEAWKSWFMVFHGGAWTGVYPWAQIAVIVAGGALGFAHLVPQLAAPAAVLLTYRLGRELFEDDAAAPLLGAALVAASPFLAFTCATLHGSTSMVVVAVGGALALVLAVKRGRFGWACVAGLVYGFGLHVRPYNAVLEGAVLGVAALVFAIRARRGVVALCLGFALGLVPALVAYLLINRAITGDALVMVVSTVQTGGKMFGFGSADRPLGVVHTPLVALGKSATNLVRLALWTSGSALAAALFVAPALGVARRGVDRLLYLPLVALLAGYYFFFTSPVYDTGPVYYLDTVPFLALLGARTLGTAAERVPARALAAFTVAGLAVAAATFWTLEGKAARGVSDFVLAPYRAVDQADLHRAIVFWPRWQEQGRRSWVWLPRTPRYDLADDVLYALDVDDKAAVRRAFPDRTLYAIHYKNGAPFVEKLP